MSIAIAHFMLGATVALWLSTLEREEYDPDGVWWIYAGGIYAMIPDMNKVLPGLISNVDDPILSNIFVFHGLLDYADPTDSIYVAVIMIILFGISVLLTRYHDLR